MNPRLKGGAQPACCAGSVFSDRLLKDRVGARRRIRSRALTCLKTVWSRGESPPPLQTVISPHYNFLCVQQCSCVCMKTEEGERTPIDAMEGRKLAVKGAFSLLVYDHASEHGGVSVLGRLRA